MKGKKQQQKSAEKSPEKAKSPEKKKEDQKKSQSNSKGKDGDKSKAKTKGGKDPLPKFENLQKNSTPKYKLDFIFRKNYLISLMKRKIAEKINVDKKLLKFYYKENEIKEERDKENLHQMIKDDPYPIIEVKKETLNEQNIISLNTKVNLVYKVECEKITDYIDFINQIEQFFKDICIENHYLCEPIKTNTYNVCFLCSDHCFQFKRYMMNISRMNKLYEKAKFTVLGADKSQIIEPEVEVKEEVDDESYGKVEKMMVKDRKSNKEYEIEFRKIKHKENDYFPKDFINKGPYEDTTVKKKVEVENNSKKKKKKKKEFTVY